MEDWGWNNSYLQRRPTASQNPDPHGLNTLERIHNFMWRDRDGKYFGGHRSRIGARPIGRKGKDTMLDAPLPSCFSYDVFLISDSPFSATTNINVGEEAIYTNTLSYRKRGMSTVCDRVKPTLGNSNSRLVKEYVPRSHLRAIYRSVQPLFHRRQLVSWHYRLIIFG